MTTTPTPHDCFVRENFTRLDIARDFLHHTLPQPLLDEQQVRRLLEQTLSGDPLMETFIDRYIAQGEKRGELRGKQIGEQRGKQIGEAEMLLRLIERKFGPPSKTVRNQITQADSETLLEWSERILEAQSLDEVLH